ncbi:MAG: methyltransferase domain-containing protein [Candidatus Micrarchaeota archaeon]|nr:methyltransferase domain-containing protein [Candidatus Micrarchaeota archaeon]MDE1863953.1 methyltransferase domain-containing protein [Candidatus Micrarchaeota archaeon]
MLALSTGAQAQSYYNTQAGITFAQNATAIGYNVTAVAQSDANGYGPGYFVEGLTNTGYEYQAGIAYNWFGQQDGFRFVYGVFGPSGSEIYSSSVKGVGLNGTVNSSDKILLYLGFYKGTVTMSAKDYQSGASAQAAYSSEGATKFVGNPSSASNLNGYSTGLVTQWPHLLTSQPAEQTANYTPYTVLTSGTRLWFYNYLYSDGARSVSANLTTAQLPYYSQSVYKFGNLSSKYYYGSFYTGSLSLASLQLSTYSLPKTYADKGMNCQLNASAMVSGGTPPYTYTSFIDTYTNNVYSTYSDSYMIGINCNNLPLGVHYYHIQVIDSAKESTRTPDQLIEVSADPIIGPIAATLHSSIFYNNDSVSLSAQIYNGSAPYTYSWYVNGKKIPSSNSSNLTINLPETGKNKIQFNAQDSAGYLLTQTLYASTSLNLLGIALLAVAILVAIAIAILIVRRRFFKDEDDYVYYKDEEENKDETVEQDSQAPAAEPAAEELVPAPPEIAEPQQAEEPQIGTPLASFEQLVNDKDGMARLVEESDFKAIAEKAGITPYESWKDSREFLAGTINHDGSILDVGCANGLLLRCLEEWCRYRLIPYGIDVNPERIQTAKALFPGHISNFAVMRASDVEGIEAAGFPARFDFVYFNVLDDWALDKKEETDTITKLLRLVLPNGRLVLGFYGIDAAASEAKIKRLEDLGFDLTGSVHNPSGSQIAVWMNGKD